MQAYSMVIHGGAGTLLPNKMTPEKVQSYKNALQIALDIGYKILNDDGKAIDAVEASVKSLEDCPLFNAGRGAVFTAEGCHEMDASIMEGTTMKAGAISLITGIKNPISLARDVMEKTEHVILAGEGAMAFAKSIGYQIENPEYFFDEWRYEQWQAIKGSAHFQLDHSKKESKYGTVGAVACDRGGHLAAATSTGGMTNKKWGRIGDSPIIGAGTYANNLTCAVSCTGSGEYFIRGVVAYDVSCLMEYKGLGLLAAANEVINKRIIKLGGDGGLIAVDMLGNIALPFNTDGMYRAYRKSSGECGISIYKE